MSERIVMGGDQRYKILNRDVIKYIAMFTMLLNHIAQGFLTNGTLVYKLMLSVGYFTAPVMLYFLVEGYYYTRSHKKYFLRLFLFALVSELPFCLLFGLASQGRLAFCGMNMLFTLCLCFLLICAMENLSSNILKTGVIIVVFLVSRYFDWTWRASHWGERVLCVCTMGRGWNLGERFQNGFSICSIRHISRFWPCCYPSVCRQSQTQ